MQRRHFEAIAATIRDLDLNLSSTDTVDDRAEDIRDTIAEEFAAMCRRANPNFDKSKFLEACRPNTHYRDKSRASSRL